MTERGTAGDSGSEDQQQLAPGDVVEISFVVWSAASQWARVHWSGVLSRVEQGVQSMKLCKHCGEDVMELMGGGWFHVHSDARTCMRIGLLGVEYQLEDEFGNPTYAEPLGA
jgi:hypothetical protein